MALSVARKGFTGAQKSASGLTGDNVKKVSSNWCKKKKECTLCYFVKEGRDLKSLQKLRKELE